MEWFICGTSYWLTNYCYSCNCKSNFTTLVGLLKKPGLVPIILSELLRLQYLLHQMAFCTFERKTLNISRSFCSSYFSIDLSCCQVLMCHFDEFKYYSITTQKKIYNKVGWVQNYRCKWEPNIVLLTFSVQTVLFTLLITYCYPLLRLKSRLNKKAPVLRSFFLLFFIAFCPQPVLIIY
jgi:hypothetical protein